MLAENGERPPPRDAGDDLPIEQLGRRLDSNSTPHDQTRQTQGGPSEAAVEAAERLAFDALEEMADLAIDYAEALKDAATQGDRLRIRLFGCALSGAVRAALLTIADIFAGPRGTAA
jgi:hypothetical protein